MPKGKESDDAETRKFAVRSLIAAIKTRGMNNLPVDVLHQSLETFYRCLEDYQIDRRGDVGSWVREEAMAALLQFFQQLTQAPDVVQKLGADSPAFFERVICVLL